MDERVFLTLGILRVAACLEQAGHTVEMIDASGVSNYEQAVSDHAANTSARIFGITATTPQMPAAGKIVATIRAVRPDAKIILGGPHITLINAALKRERKIGLNGRATRAFAKLQSMFDVLVAGDGEDAIFLAIATDAPSLVDADIPSGSLFLTNERLNELPWPARHLIDVDSYHYSIEGERALSLIAQLGCPFGCGFCGGRESPMLRRIRTRTTANIVNEILTMHDRYRVKGFMFYDDELNVNPSMVELMKAIGKAQKDLGVEFRLRGFIKSQLFTDEQAEAMYEAGFRWILVGFESGSERILENINKKANRAENTRCMDIAKRHGLKVKALMSIGHPGESEQTIMETHNWLLEVEPDDFDATCITVYPGTPYFDHAVQKPGEIRWTYTYPKTGDKLYAEEVDFSEDQNFYKGKPGEYVSHVHTDFLSSEELVKLRDFVESDIRSKLNVAYNPSAPGIRYEASMGMTKLPPNILRTT